MTKTEALEMIIEKANEYISHVNDQHYALDLMREIYDIALEGIEDEDEALHLANKIQNERS